jgi:hypothetical protein
VSKIGWSDYQEEPMSDVDYESRKKRGEYVDGCAVITGRLWRGPYKDKNLVCFDFDNSIAIEVFLEKTLSILGCKTLEELSQKTIVEEHEDAKGKRAHVYFVTAGLIAKRNKPQGNRSMAGMRVPELEVKSDSSTYAVCSPTVHMNGYPYQITGTRDPLILDEKQSKNLDDQIKEIYNSYSSNSSYSNSSLSDELRLVAITRRIGKDIPKIPQGSRSNTLISLVRVILNQHYDSTDIQDIRSFVEDVNQKLCDPPLDQDEIDGIWERDFKYLLNDLESGKFKRKRTRYTENGEASSEFKSKTEFLAFKYTFKGQTYEAVIVGDKPFFLTLKNDEVILESRLEEETRILRPPALEEYPSYAPYNFRDKDEINKFVETLGSQKVTLDNLVTNVKEQISKYIVHHNHILDYITALTIFSYFQDRFPTVPYTMFVSDNGSGKSTIGNVFECYAYRCVNMTDPTTANIFRIFGTIESGQCILVLDEAEKIDQEKEMMGVMKNGYENGKKVQRINPFGKQEHFQTYGVKIMLAERSPNPFHAKGVLDRTFVISNFRGKPLKDIKETKISKRGKIEFAFYRNLLLIYRLLHVNEKVTDIDTGLEGRDKELCKPLLQLFFKTAFQTKVEKVLEALLDEKNMRKANSLEREVLEVIIDLIKSEEHTDGIIPIPNLWDGIIRKTNASTNQFGDHNVVSESHGPISKNTILKMVRDRFGAKAKRYSNTRCLCFDLDKILRNYEDYIKEEKPTRIVCQPLINNDDANDANDANIETLFKSFGQKGDAPSTNTSIIDESKMEDKVSVHSHNINFDRQTEKSFSQSQGLENSVISVISVTAPQTRNNLKATGVIETDLQVVDHANNIFRKWKGRDTWACNNCNDTGDRPYMLKHPCKGNKNG